MGIKHCGICNDEVFRTVPTFSCVGIQLSEVKEKKKYKYIRNRADGSGIYICKECIRKHYIGRKVNIMKNVECYGGEWGTICHYDDNGYYVAIADDYKSIPVFNRNEFTLARKVKKTC